ncbi:sterol carrier family protein [Enemella sp. A6]|uniref:sterol carrier family protein n=1 Tax=Enemella sp. A6 TaxID=3440152 RepID=UPI003EB7F2D7
MTTVAAHQTVADLLLTQMLAVVQWLDPLTAAEFRSRDQYNTWSVRHLIGHLISAQEDLLTAVNRPSTSRPMSINHYLRRRWARNSHPMSRALEICGSDSDRVLLEHLASGAGELRGALEQLDAGVLDEHRDPVRVVDLLRVELAHWLGHGEDLRVILPHRGAVATSRPALADAIRLLTAILAKEYPGRAIELRVPPFAAVQLGVPQAPGSTERIGPTHTRGTPPNVVEMNSPTLLRLVSGGGDWADELSAGNISASGPHADLRSVFPILR